MWVTTRHEAGWGRVDQLRQVHRPRIGPYRPRVGRAPVWQLLKPNTQRTARPFDFMSGMNILGNTPLSAQLNTRAEQRTLRVANLRAILASIKCCVPCGTRCPLWHPVAHTSIQGCEVAISFCCSWRVPLPMRNGRSDSAIFSSCGNTSFGKLVSPFSICSLSIEI